MNNIPNTLEEPARQVPVVEDTDVLVAGGGPAGIAAALAAAREGARTVLIERYGYLGGMITGARVVWMNAGGDGFAPKVRGIFLEIRRRLEEYDAVAPLQCGDYRVDAEVFKWRVAEMLLEAGVNIRLHTLACLPVLQEGAVAGAFIESKSGRQAVRAQVTVDATADADLAYRAGCECEDEMHDVTLGLRIDGIDRERVEAFRAESPDEYEGIVAEAASLNGGAVLGRDRYLKGVDVTDAMALTHAEIQLRRGYFATLALLREKLPGYENARIAETRPQIGVRMSRRVRGEYRLVDDDLQSSRHFSDGIARLGAYLVGYQDNYTIKGLDYDVPYRCLVPEKTDGLLVAGRSVSCDFQTGNSLRLIAPCLATGQAAGIAAAIAVQDGCLPRHVSIEKLKGALVRQDVNLG